MTRSLADRLTQQRLDDKTLIVDPITGAIYSTLSPGRKRQLLVEPRLLNGVVTSHGYIKIGLTVPEGVTERRRFTAYAHRIVWMALHGPIPDGYDVDHLDYDKTNYKPTNLQLLIHAENVERSRWYRAQQQSTSVA